MWFSGFKACFPSGSTELYRYVEGLYADAAKGAEMGAAFAEIEQSLAKSKKFPGGRDCTKSAGCVLPIRSYNLQFSRGCSLAVCILFFHPFASLVGDANVLNLYRLSS